MAAGSFSVVMDPHEVVGVDAGASGRLTIRFQGGAKSAVVAGDLVTLDEFARVGAYAPAVSSGYTVELPTDVASGGDPDTSAVGYDLKWFNGDGVVNALFVGQPDGSTVNLSDLAATESIPLAQSAANVLASEAARDEAVTAAAAAVAVGTTNDTVIAGRVAAAGSATDVAIDAKLAKSSVPVFNVKHYGAVGDGSTNDATAINAAITAANAAGGGIVLFPYTATSYAVSAQITMRTGVTLRGVNKVKVKRITSSGTQMISVNASQTDMVFEDLTIDANGLASSFIVLVPNTASRIRFSRCKFMDTKTVTTGLQLRSSDTVVEDCEFDSIKAPIEVNYAPTRVMIRRNVITNWLERGIRVLGSSTNGAVTGLTIEHNLITDVDTAGTVRQPIQFAGDDAAPFNRVKVNFNTVIGPNIDLSVGGTADQISIHRCRDFEVIGNHSIDGGDMGITVAQQCARGVVSGNVVTGADNAGIAIGSSSSTFTRDIAVTGNTFINNGQNRSPGSASDSGRAGIRAYGAAGLAISGNVLGDDQGTKTQRYGVSLANCTNVALGPDVDTGNTLATYFKDGGGNTSIVKATTAAF